MSGAPYLAAEHTDASIINAGDGAHAHPTQALLDLYTMRKHFGDLRDKRVVMVGDISHSRVARSDMWGLSKMGAEVVVCGPPTLLPRGLRVQDRPAHAEAALPRVTVETDVARAITDIPPQIGRRGYAIYAPEGSESELRKVDEYRKACSVWAIQPALATRLKLGELLSTD